MLMLALSPGESLLIGPDIRIEVDRVTPGQGGCGGVKVRLACHVPAHLHIDRLDRNGKSKQRAPVPPPGSLAHHPV